MKKLVAFLVLVLAALILVACGSSSDDHASKTANGESAESSAGGSASEESGGSTLKIRANPSNLLKYEPSTATVKAGKVTIDFNNPQGEYHDVVIENAKGEEVGATGLITERETSATVELEPGVYHYFCSFPHHREGGMEGVLTVK